MASPGCILYRKNPSPRDFAQPGEEADRQVVDLKDRAVIGSRLAWHEGLILQAFFAQAVGQKVEAENEAHQGEGRGKGRVLVDRQQFAAIVDG